MLHPACHDTLKSGWVDGVGGGLPPCIPVLSPFLATVPLQEKAARKPDTSQEDVHVNLHPTNGNKCGFKESQVSLKVHIWLVD